MTYPNRNCSRGTNRLHRAASLRHSESIESTTSPNMRRASTNSSAILLSGGRSSPHDGSTPLIEDDSNHPYSSKRSTPCPPRPAAASLTDSEATQQPPSSTRATPSDREVSTQPEHHARNGDAAATWEEERNLTDTVISLRQKLDASSMCLLNQMF